MSIIYVSLLTVEKSEAFVLYSISYLSYSQFKYSSISVKAAVGNFNKKNFFVIFPQTVTMFWQLYMRHIICEKIRFLSGGDSYTLCEAVRYTECVQAVIDTVRDSSWL